MMMHHNKDREKKRKKRIDHLLCITFTQTNEICSSLHRQMSHTYTYMYIYTETEAKASVVFI
jgi:hypothetical protein